MERFTKQIAGHVPNSCLPKKMKSSIEIYKQYFHIEMSDNDWFWRLCLFCCTGWYDVMPVYSVCLTESMLGSIAHVQLGDLQSETYQPRIHTSTQTLSVMDNVNMLRVESDCLMLFTPLCTHYLFLMCVFKCVTRSTLEVKGRLCVYLRVRWSTSWIQLQKKSLKVFKENVFWFLDLVSKLVGKNNLWIWKKEKTRTAPLQYFMSCFQIMFTLIWNCSAL